MHVQGAKVCVVGLGYVGLPLAHAFARKGFPTIGYDISEERIKELKQGNDRTKELSEAQLKGIKVTFSTDPAMIAQATVIILAIPTPVDEQNKPDLTLLKNATETVGKNLRKGTTVVYESTVYPGVTEEVCGSILEQQSGMKRGRDFKLGYSPERINPGDREHTIDRIVKVVAGEDDATADLLAEIYGSIVPAGIHKAPSIKVAEMAKAIENAQRDINIAYINEIAMLCHKLGIETRDVLAAAETKWNFLSFTPGLVGGHCIGVDPYYLLEKGRELNDGMPLITAARAINDRMAQYVTRKVMEHLPSKRTHVLVLGLTFKPDIPDTRNSQSRAVVQQLQNAGFRVSTHDPYVEDGDLLHFPKHDAILLLVPHKEYLRLRPGDFAKLANDHCLFYDLKSVFPRKEMEEAGFIYLAL